MSSFNLRRTLASAAVLLLAAGGTAATLAAQAGPRRAAAVKIVAAGDIAVCHSDGDERTAALADSLGGEVLVLGDDAYPSGSQRDFQQCYGPSWGRFRARTHPAPGNHEYYTSGAAPYYAYFGPAAGPAGRGYYSFDLGDWHIISLNSVRGTEGGAEQERWLRADLAAHPARCTLAYWHHPRFSSGPHGSTPRMAGFWQILQDAGAEVVLGGHDHHYERFAPMTADGRADPGRGIRSFVVGTGGAERYRFVTPVPGSEFRWGADFGVLKLELGASAYDWQFIAVGGRVVDRGHGRCR